MLRNVIPIRRGCSQNHRIGMHERWFQNSFNVTISCFTCLTQYPGDMDNQNV